MRKIVRNADENRATAERSREIHRVDSRASVIASVPFQRASNEINGHLALLILRCSERIRCNGGIKVYVGRVDDGEGRTRDVERSD